jgi:two-component system response regulator HydG
VEHFFAEARAKYPDSPVRRFGAAALGALRRHPWPGNVRELAHVVEKVVLLGQGAEVGVDDLPEGVGQPMRGEPFEFRGDVLPMREVERRYAAWAVGQTGGHRGKAAEKLGIDPKTLRKWLEGSEPDGSD